jgi:DnaD/phage-associated family protein
MNDKNYVVVTDYVKANTGEDVSDALQQLIFDNPHRTIFFPDGEYVIAKPICTSANPANAVTLMLSDFATIKAAEGWDSEEAMIRKWFDTFAYSPVIVSEAYDICVMNTGSLSFGYMDKIISAWHEAGRKTLEECKAKRAVDKAETSSSQSQKRGRSKSDPPKPRYGDFDISDAFAKALARSYEEN